MNEPYGVYRVSRESEGGKMVLLWVLSDKLVTPQVETYISQFQILGRVPGPKALLLQISYGNYIDFLHVIKEYLQTNIRLVMNEKTGFVLLETWEAPNKVSSLAFQFACLNPEQVRNINALTYAYAQGKTDDDPV